MALWDAYILWRLYLSYKNSLYREIICDTSTLCQCTGLKDKNDKLIWENDICNYYNPEDKDGIGIIKMVMFYG